MAKLFVNPEVKKGHINPELQGHFSEHLGRCIYEGIYVGEDSDIPNVNGMRKDVVEAMKNLKMPVIAEGVETENQLAMLKRSGCDFVQGYYFSRPVPPEEFEKFIARQAGDSREKP